MIGTTLIKGQYKQEDYAEAAKWCNSNNAMIVDKGEYYEVVGIPEPTNKEKWKAEATQKRINLRELAIQSMMNMLVGADITEAQTEYQNELNSVSDDVALYMSDMFPAWNGASVEYKEGQRVLYNGVLYRVVKDHTSQETWKPDITPSEYTKVISSIHGEIPEWEQPLPTNAYKLGDRVKHNGRYYESTYDGDNVWEPGVVGEEYWKDITDEIGEAS